jgi:hypothetical protein
MLLEHAVRHALGFWQALCHSYEGELLIKRGDAASGIRCLRIGLHELRDARYVLRFPRLLSALAEGMAAVGQVAQARVVIDEALAQCEHTEERWSMTELAHQGRVAPAGRRTRGIGSRREPVPARARLGASASRAVFGTALRHQPCPAVARPGAERRGPSAPGRNLPSVHRGLRNRPTWKRQNR